MAPNFQRRENRPWGAVVLALALLSVGIFSLTLWLLIMFGALDASWTESASPLFVVGMLGFLPGFYETRIAYLAWRGCPGYSFEQIPRFDD